MTSKAAPEGKSFPGSVLHVGCGFEALPVWLGGLAETRLDIDPRCEPDVVATMTALGDIGPFDVVYSSHSLEHLAPHDVGVALGEFRRVLREGGALVVAVPDLEDARPTEDVLFVSPAGPITGLDLFYGFRSALEAQPYMAHRTGFVRDTLMEAFDSAGFSAAKVERQSNYNLVGVARK